MKTDLELSFGKGSVRTKFSENYLDRMASTVAKTAAEELYYGLIFARYLPEIKAIESGKLKALKNEEAKEYMKKLLKR